MVSFFWHDLAIHGPENGPKLIIFPNALFLRFPWDLPTILVRGPNPNAPKNAVFDPRSYSKGPNHALEKVLTNETPGILCRSRNLHLFCSACDLRCLQSRTFKAIKLRRRVCRHRVRKRQPDVGTSFAFIEWGLRTVDNISTCPGLH